MCGLHKVFELTASSDGLLKYTGSIFAWRRTGFDLFFFSLKKSPQNRTTFSSFRAWCSKPKIIFSFFLQRAAWHVSQKNATRLARPLWSRGGKNKKPQLCKTHLPKLHALNLPLFKPQNQQSLKVMLKAPFIPFSQSLRSREANNQKKTKQINLCRQLVLSGAWCPKSDMM